MAASFCFSAGPAARAAGGDLAERAVPPGLLVYGLGQPAVRRVAAAVFYPLAPFAGGQPQGLSEGFPSPAVTGDLGALSRPMMLLQASTLSSEDPDGPGADGAMPEAISSAPSQIDQVTALPSPDCGSSARPPPRPAGHGRCGPPIARASSTRSVLWLAAVRHPAMSRENASMTNPV